MTGFSGAGYATRGTQLAHYTECIVIDVVNRRLRLPSQKVEASIQGCVVRVAL
jgi:hypothetical protein